MPGPTITAAISTYDRHAPLFDGTVSHPDFSFDFRYVEPGAARGRHELFLHEAAWDVAELSFSSYLVAVDRGLPFQAIPVFPRRLFSQSQMYKYRDAGIALTTYQTTLSVLAKGDLAHYYGVPWKEITFVTAREETLDVPLPPGVKLERVESAAALEAELVAGSVQAQFTPSPPRAFIEGNPSIVRLFDDPRAEEERHLLKEPGYFPIMHVVAIQRAVVERHPELPRALFDVFEAAQQAARRRWNDPNHSLLLWGKQAAEREASIFDRDPWANGLTANRKNIEDFVRYSHEQGLIRRLIPPEELFVPIE